MGAKLTEWLLMFNFNVNLASHKCPHIWSNIILNLFVKMFLNKINI